MTISAGSYSIGSGAQNYATLAAAIADIASSTLTGNLTFTYETAVTETAQADLQIDLAGYTLRITSNSDPEGRFGNGNLISLNYATASTGWLLHRPTGSGTVQIDHLDVKQITNSASGARMFRDFGATASNTLIMFDNVFDGDSKVLNGYGWEFADADSTKEIYSNRVRGMNISLMISSANQAGSFDNNTWLGTIYCVWFNGAQITSGGGFINNCCYGGTSYNGTHTSTVGKNNAGDDTTGANATWSSGSGNVVSITSGDFQDTSTVGAATYFLPAITGALDGTNTTPTASFSELANGKAVDCIGAMGLGSAVNQKPEYYYRANKKRRSY